jgi:hypothetical protein
MATTLAQRRVPCQIEFIEFMETAYVPYVVGGVLFGLIFGELVRPLRAVRLFTTLAKSFKRKPPETVVDENTLIRCGSCRSIIMTPPIMRTVADGKDTLIFQCQQCATQVGVIVTSL